MAKEKEVTETVKNFPVSLQLLTVVMGILLVVSAIGAVQLLSLNDAVNKQNAKIVELQGTAPATNNTQQSNGSNSPSNLANLPSMVGGC